MSTKDNSTILILEKVSQARRILNLMATQALKPLKIGPKQGVLIRYLAKNGTSSLADLSRATWTDPAATGKAVDCLIQRNWIEREEHETDRRRWNLKLTPLGKKIAAQIETALTEISNKTLENFTLKERQSFIQFLDLLIFSLSNEYDKGLSKE